MARHGNTGEDSEACVSSDDEDAYVDDDQYKNISDCEEPSTSSDDDDNEMRADDGNEESDADSVDHIEMDIGDCDTVHDSGASFRKLLERKRKERRLEVPLAKHVKPKRSRANAKTVPSFYTQSAPPKASQPFLLYVDALGVLYDSVDFLQQTGPSRTLTKIFRSLVESLSVCGSTVFKMRPGLRPALLAYRDCHVEVVTLASEVGSAPLMEHVNAALATVLPRARVVSVKDAKTLGDKAAGRRWGLLSTRERSHYFEHAASCGVVVHVPKYSFFPVTLYAEDEKRGRCPLDAPSVVRSVRCLQLDQPIDYSDASDAGLVERECFFGSNQTLLEFVEAAKEEIHRVEDLKNKTLANGRPAPLLRPVYRRRNGVSSAPPTVCGIPPVSPFADVNPNACATCGQLMEHAGGSAMRCPNVSCAKHADGTVIVSESIIYGNASGNVHDSPEHNVAGRKPLNNKKHDVVRRVIEDLSGKGKRLNADESFVQRVVDDAVDYSKKEKHTFAKSVRFVLENVGNLASVTSPCKESFLDARVTQVYTKLDAFLTKYPETQDSAANIIETVARKHAYLLDEEYFSDALATYVKETVRASTTTKNTTKDGDSVGFRRCVAKIRQVCG